MMRTRAAQGNFIPENFESLNLLMDELVDPNENFVQVGSAAEHALVTAVKRNFFSNVRMMLFGKLLPLISTNCSKEINEVKEKKLKKLCERRKEINSLINRYMADPLTDKGLLGPIECSKTAISGLKYVAVGDLNKMKEKEVNGLLNDFFRIVLILGRSTEKENNPIENFLKLVTKEGGSVRELFLRKVLNDLDFDEEETNFMSKFYQEKGTIMGPDLLQWSRSCSYLSFIVKEILAYISNSQTKFDGCKIECIRKMKKEVDTLNELTDLFSEFVV